MDFNLFYDFYIIDNFKLFTKLIFRNMKNMYLFLIDK